MHPDPDPRAALPCSGAPPARRAIAGRGRPPASRRRPAFVSAAVAPAARRAVVGAALVAAALAAGCASERAYRRAIADAAVMEPAEALPLAPVTADPVRVAAWTETRHLGSYPEGEPMVIDWDLLWVALESEERARCAGFPRRNLERRLEQLLGLPPTGEPRRYVVLEVARSALRRPCFEPDPTAARCPLEPAPGVPQEFLDWLGANALASYRVPGGFPWTRLGYTYDWRPGAPEYGVAEFVLLRGTAARVVAILPAEEFCRPPGAAPAP